MPSILQVLGSEIPRWTFFLVLDPKMQLISHAKKSMVVVAVLCWEFMEKFLYSFEEIRNKLSLLCHIENEEGRVVLWVNSQLVDLLKNLLLGGGHPELSAPLSSAVHLSVLLILTQCLSWRW